MSILHRLRRQVLSHTRLARLLAVSAVLITGICVVSVWLARPKIIKRNIAYWQTGSPITITLITIDGLKPGFQSLDPNTLVPSLGVPLKDTLIRSAILAKSAVSEVTGLQIDRLVTATEPFSPKILWRIYWAKD